jgi:hypothetical protein
MLLAILIGGLSFAIWMMGAMTTWMFLCCCVLAIGVGRCAHLYLS